MLSCFHLHSFTFNEVEICVHMFTSNLYFCVIFFYSWPLLIFLLKCYFFPLIFKRPLQIKKLTIWHILQMYFCSLSFNFNFILTYTSIDSQSDLPTNFSFVISSMIFIFRKAFPNLESDIYCLILWFHFTFNSI